MCTSKRRVSGDSSSPHGSFRSMLWKIHPGRRIENKNLLGATSVGAEASHAKRCSYRCPARRRPIGLPVALADSKGNLPGPENAMHMISDARGNFARVSAVEAL
jgi:hypothetical protein